jgi:2-oxoisovalerate dehydrogenase E2 component (dihydrolipoyl transacylase)
MTATTFHRVRSDHPEDDALGRVFGPGELITNLDLTSEEYKDFNQRKVDDGIFYPVDESNVSPDEVPAMPSAGSSGPDATDAAVRMAEENNIDLTQLEGTGKDGRIIDADVEAAIEAATASGGEDNSSEGDD